ncbi:MAG: ATP-grasp domain-containing protein [Opitutales bacterium]|nr:ATP-grasp domain-containing protein [Opitutales bacterium]MCH8539776.1 ATP-grasp domain-containing protein [Opitutales bacterium]
MHNHQKCQRNSKPYRGPAQWDSLQEPTKVKTILVTGIGGNVGQGILRNILADVCSYRTIGTNTTPVSAGNRFIDVFYAMPFGLDPSYIPEMLAIVKSEGVDLIIPSTDFEMMQLSKFSDAFECPIACSGPASAEIYLDKYRTYQEHRKAQIPFAETCLPSSYQNQFSRALAKPRRGRGSRGLIFDPTEFSQLSDEDYVIQELHQGREITTAVYRCYMDGVIHGSISMYRTLHYGATDYCRVVRDYDAALRDIAEKMASNFDIRGSFNIQSIVTDSGEIHPFEVNCRISGTNSIRSHFGFADVNYALSELLWHKAPKKFEAVDGEAYRYLADVIYLDSNPATLAHQKNENGSEVIDSAQRPLNK